MAGNWGADQKAYGFDPDRLAKAIAATFERRRTAIPSEVPDGAYSGIRSRREQAAAMGCFCPRASGQAGLARGCSFRSGSLSDADGCKGESVSANRGLKIIARPRIARARRKV